MSKASDRSVRPVLPKAIALVIATWLAVTTGLAGVPAWLEGGHPERVSSGVMGIWELQHSPIGGRLATPQASPTPVALDPRVGPNVSCGPDPASLPASRRAQAEPHVARHPHNPDILLATFQDGRLVDGGAITCGYAVSGNGGLSWKRSIIPKLTKSDGGSVDRATDPVAAMSPDGTTFYLNTLGIQGANLNIGVLYLSRSKDGGSSFLPPVEIYRSPNTSFFPDKNWMVVNTFPGTSTFGRIVVSFTRFTFSNGASSPIAAVHSDDEGLTWSAPVLVTRATAQCQGSQPVFLPDGRLAMVFWDFASGSGSGEALKVSISADGGSTFAPPTTVVPGILSYDDPNIRDGVDLPSATVDPAGGVLWVTYQATVGGIARILVVHSTNGGMTWSIPRVVSTNPAGKSVFNPVVSVSPNGRTVLVAFWDNRAGSDALMVDTWVAASYDGGTTWQPNLRITSVSTDVRLAPLTSRGYMMGDYFGLVAPADGLTAAVALTIDTRDGEPQPLSARFGAGPVLTFDTWRAGRFSRAFITDPATGGPEADVDLDGIDLFAEYAFGTDPGSPDRPRLLVHGVPEGVSITFPRNAAATDARVLLEESADLQSWSAVELIGLSPADSLPTVLLPVPGVAHFYRLRAVPL